ncbi:MAG: ribose-phosphate pyrophosphokinase [Bacteroidota bacterium]
MQKSSSSPLINHHSEVKLFSGNHSERLATKIAKKYGKSLGNIQVNRFSDGEMQPVILESVRGSYFFIIQSTTAPADNLMELLLIIDAAKRASAGYISAIIPYFGYARQDRKDKSRVPISAKLVVELLQAAGADRVVSMDFHADQLQGFFDIPVDHLQGQIVFFKHLKRMDMSNVTFAAPDVGGVKRARSYAQQFQTDLVICDKQRVRANEVAGMTLIGDVTGKDVILVDDLVDTAGTLCRAANLMIEEGARSVRAICTHAVLSGDAYKNIEKSALSELIVSDTIPLRKESKKITVLSVAKVFATAIRNTHEHKSITGLFVKKYG